MVSLTIFADSILLKFNEPVGWRDDVLKQKQYRKKSGEVTKFVW